jgi:chloride channel protein, CIC family
MSGNPAAPAPAAPAAPPEGALHSVRARLTRFLSGSLLAEGQFFVFLSLVIGLFGGLSVVCFRLAIDSMRMWLLGSSLHPSAPRVVLVPAIAGLVVAFLVLRFFPRARGSGVNQTKAAVYIFDGRIPFNTVIGKFLTCALGIGSGQSLGPEDPSLQIGAGIASALGRRMHLSREKLRLIAPVGAAAGLAAAFNSPISAVLFVIEEVIGNWSAGVLGAVVVSAVASVTVARWFLGDAPLFRVPVFHLRHPVELLAYAVLGIISGYFSVGFLKLVLTLRPRLRRLPSWAQYLLPGAAGLLIGLIGLRFPQVMGAGYDYIDQALHDQYAWKLLFVLAALKLFSTSASFVSGAPGGLFAPILFMGAMLGGAVGGVEHLVFPSFAGPVGSFALVGMGTLFAGILRVPMTSIFMVVEITGDYSVIVPVMISNAIAYVISRHHQSVTLFDELSRQDGITLPSMEERREETQLRVEHAMRRYGAPALPANEALRIARDRVAGANEAYLLVLGDFGWGGFPAELLGAGDGKGANDVAVVTLCTHRNLPTLHPDEPLETALRLLEDRPLLPVVRRTDQGILQGVVSLQDVLQAYRRDEEAAHAQQGSS